MFHKCQREKKASNSQKKLREQKILNMGKMLYGEETFQFKTIWYSARI